VYLVPYLIVKKFSIRREGQNWVFINGPQLANNVLYIFKVEFEMHKIIGVPILHPKIHENFFIAAATDSATGS
jgi:hypothetical protein